MFKTMNMGWADKNRFWLCGGLADGVAEVALVDAVELVGGREVHGLDDVADLLT